MAGKNIPNAEANEILSRIESVFGERNLTSSQRNLFETTANQIVSFGWDPNNALVSLVEHVGNYWRNWLLMIFNTGSYRPSMVMKLLGALDPSHPISQRMLTLNLRLLERDGLIYRRVVNTEVIHVEYGLTPLGKEFADQVSALIEWIGDHAGEVEKARALAALKEQDPNAGDATFPARCTEPPKQMH